MCAKQAGLSSKTFHADPVCPVEGLRIYFERYIKDEISVSDFKTAQDKAHKSKKRLDAAMRELEVYEHIYISLP